MQDVVHLKNGDIYKGIIIENAPNDYVRIELQGGSVLTVHYSDIAKFTKERPEQVEKPKKQQLPQTSNNFDSQKLMSYQQQKKSNGTAILLSILLTSTGHAYAGNWGRGLIFSAGRIGGIILAFTAGYSNFTRQEEPYYFNGGYSSGGFTSGDETNAWFYLGIAISVGAAVWEVIDASMEVDRYNQKLYNRIMGNQFSFDIMPVKYGAKFQFRYNF